MSSVYLQSAALHSALAANLSDAARAVQSQRLPHSCDFTLLERNELRRYFPVQQQQSLREHLHASINTVHSEQAIPFADCLLDRKSVV